MRHAARRTWRCGEPPRTHLAGGGARAPRRESAGGVGALRALARERESVSTRNAPTPAPWTAVARSKLWCPRVPRGALLMRADELV